MIICESCQDVLDDNNPHRIENKLCIKCVQKKMPGADLSKILTPDNQFQKPTNGGVSLQERFKSIQLEFEYELIEGDYRVAFKLKDYFKKPFFTFALGKKELADMLADIQDLEDYEAPEDPL